MQCNIFCACYTASYFVLFTKIQETYSKSGKTLLLLTKYKWQSQIGWNDRSTKKYTRVTSYSQLSIFYKPLVLVFLFIKYSYRTFGYLVHYEWIYYYKDGGLWPSLLCLLLRVLYKCLLFTCACVSFTTIFMIFPHDELYYVTYTPFVRS